MTVGAFVARCGIHLSYGRRSGDSGYATEMATGVATQALIGSHRVRSWVIRERLRSRAFRASDHR